MKYKIVYQSTDGILRSTYKRKITDKMRDEILSYVNNQSVSAVRVELFANGGTIALHTFLIDKDPNGQLFAHSDSIEYLTIDELCDMYTKFTTVEVELLCLICCCK